MQSSYRIIKNQNISNEEKGISIINTKAMESYKKEKQELMDKEKAEEVSLTSDKIQKEILIKLEEERLHIIKTAKKQANAIISDAKKQGYKKGYDIGYKEGINRAREEALGIKNKALGLIKQAEEDVSNYFRENQENIIRLSAQMAEAIIHHKIDTSDENMLMLIKPILENYEGNGNIVITCHPDKVALMKEKAKELQTISGDSRFIVLGDETLEKYDCTIENQYQFIDLQIKKQLESIVAEINSME